MHTSIMASVVLSTYNIAFAVLLWLARSVVFDVKTTNPRAPFVRLIVDRALGRTNEINDAYFPQVSMHILI